MASVRALLFLCVLGVALAKTPVENVHPIPVLDQGLLGAYEGTFQWDGMKAVQPLRFKLEKVVSQKGNQVVAEGRGVYMDTNTRILVRCEVDTATLEFKLFEGSPEGPASQSFVTDGYHRGTFTPGYGSARGRWVSPKGESGTLRFRRAGR